MEQLKQLERNLIDAAKKNQEAIGAAMKAEKSYDEQWEKVSLSNPEFKKTWEDNNAAQKAVSVAKSDYSDVKAATVKSLLELTNPDEMKEVDAFGYRRSVKASYANEGAFIRQIIESGMLFLLKPDDAAITTFTKAMAVDFKDDSGAVIGHCLPDNVFSVLPLNVETVIKPTISDPKIAKLAK